MKHSSFSCLLLILSSILLLSQQSYARKDLGGYWKSVMNDQPMPEAIRGLLFQQDHGKNQFVRDFDMRPNLIIYHSAHNHHEQQPAELGPFSKDVKGNHA